MQLSSTTIVEIKITIICGKTKGAQIFNWFWIGKFKQWTRFIGFGEDTQYTSFG